MKDILGALNAIPGVLGSVVFSTNGQCLESNLQPPYEPVLFLKALEQVKAAGEMLSHISEHPCSTGILRFETGYLYLRGLKSSILLVLANSSVNLSMVNVGCNVAGLKIEVALGETSSQISGSFQMPLHDSGKISGRLDAKGSVSTSGSYPSFTPNQGALQSATTTPHSGNKLLETTPSHAGIIAPPDAIGREAVEELLKALARQVGPFAKVYIKEQLVKMGASASTINAAQFGDLCTLLVGYINEAPRKQTFLEEAKKISVKR